MCALWFASRIYIYIVASGGEYSEREKVLVRVPRISASGSNILKGGICTGSKISSRFSAAAAADYVAWVVQERERERML